MIPVVIVAANSQDADEIKGFEMGATDFIPKPVSPPLLLARIRTRLALGSVLRELEKENDLLSKNLRLREDVERISRHDLKGPLTAVINIQRMLLQGKNLAPNQIELLGQLSESAHRMLEMVNRSAGFYRMEQNMYQYVPVPVNLVKIVLQVFQEFNKLAEAKKVTCSLFIGQKPTGGDEKFQVNGEDLLFFFMLSNLIKNAIEASPEKAEVLVILDDSLIPTISIKNQGAIPLPIREKHFERYTTHGKPGGTGLGVYSARMIAKTLGGEISFVTSESEGTTFRVSLPPSEEPLTEVFPASKELPEIGKTSSGVNPKGEMKILVVDDYPFMRRIIMDILSQDGFAAIFEAGDGSEAMALLEKTPVDLVLSDWFMPGKSGLDLFEFMQNNDRLRRIPFIMITANVSLPEFEKAAEKGLRNYITKPFSSDILKKKVKSVLSKAQGEAHSV
jgi:DNA-binding response OmpR family regulator